MYKAKVGSKDTRTMGLEFTHEFFFTITRTIDGKEEECTHTIVAPCGRKVNHIKIDQDLEALTAFLNK